MVIYLEKEKNKLGLTLEDYRCPVCHTLHAYSFVKNRPLRRCRSCQSWLIQNPA